MRLFVVLLVGWIGSRCTGAGEPIPALLENRPIRRATFGRPPEWRAGDRWRIPSRNGSDAILQVGTVEWGPAGGTVVRGRLEGDPASNARWVARDGRLAAMLDRADGSRWLVLPAEDGGHRIVEPKGTDEVRCGNEHLHEVEGPGFPIVGEERVARAGPVGDSLSILDLLLAYTPAASEGAGGAAGLRALAELSVVEANDAFERSAIRLRLRIVGFLGVEYTESGELTTDLTRLTRQGDGWLEEVHARRDELAADVVCLVTERENSNQYAGMANQLRTLDEGALERGFTVCLRPYLIGNYTLAHEVGHLLGGNHDRETNPEGGLRTAAFGARFSVDGRVYRTVMAYRPGIQVPHFSNPNVAFRGVPTGVRGSADNAETLNWVAPRLAAIRNRDSRIGFATPTRDVGEWEGSVTVSLERTGLTWAGGEVRIRTRDGTARAGSDYEAYDSRITLPGGAGSLPVTVSIRNTPDREGTRWFWLVIEEPSSDLGVGPGEACLVRIRDDEESSGPWIDTSFRASPGADHAVAALAKGTGEWLFVGGGFWQYGGQERPRVARIGPDGSVDPGFHSKVKYGVASVAALRDGRVALGGEFNTVNDVRVNHVALLNADGSLDTNFVFETGTDLPVRAMALAPGGQLVLGGDFTSVEGVPALRVARITAKGSPDPTFDTRAGADGPVTAVLVDGANRTIIGGRFGRVDGVARGRLARLDPRGRLDPDFASETGADGDVRALAIDARDRVLAAGDFLRFGGRQVGRIVRLTADGKRDPEFRAGTGAGADDAILAICPRLDGHVWIAGKFLSVDGARRSRIARLREDGSVDPDFDPGWGANDAVHALLERHDGGLVIGGVFTEVMGVTRQGVAVLFSELPDPVRVTGLDRSPAGLRWRARGWPRQTYAVESSANLRYWHREAEVLSETGELEGNLPSSEAPAGFVRLRRVVE